MSLFPSIPDPPKLQQIPKGTLREVRLLLLATPAPAGRPRRKLLHWTLEFRQRRALEKLSLKRRGQNIKGFPVVPGSVTTSVVLTVFLPAALTLLFLFRGPRQIDNNNRTGSKGPARSMAAGALLGPRLRGASRTARYPLALALGSTEPPRRIELRLRAKCCRMHHIRVASRVVDTKTFRLCVRVLVALHLPTVR